MRVPHGAGKSAKGEADTNKTFKRVQAGLSLDSPTSSGLTKRQGTPPPANVLEMQVLWTAPASLFARDSGKG